ncbi:hypothetical protein N9B09_00690 [bacterium]|nr:hypothetical protein [bacterium]
MVSFFKKYGTAAPLNSVERNELNQASQRDELGIKTKNDKPNDTSLEINSLKIVLFDILTISKLALRRLYADR